MNRVLLKSFLCFLPLASLPAQASIVTLNWESVVTSTSNASIYGAVGSAVHHSISYDTASPNLWTTLYGQPNDPNYGRYHINYTIQVGTVTISNGSPTELEVLNGGGPMGGWYGLRFDQQFPGRNVLINGQDSANRPDAGGVSYMMRDSLMCLFCSYSTATGNALPTSLADFSSYVGTPNSNFAGDLWTDSYGMQLVEWQNVAPSPQNVPAPAVASLFLIGFAAMGFSRRRWRW